MAKSAVKTDKVWRYPHKKFSLEKKVLLKQTNALGNVYFANFADWQGEVRESFLLENPEYINYMSNNQNLIIVTRVMHIDFYSSAFFGDTISIEMTTSNIQSYSLFLDFVFYDKKNRGKIADGYQKICFINRTTGELIKIPQLFLEMAISIKAAQAKTSP